MKVGYHAVNFDGHKHSDSRDIVVLFCHVISQDIVMSLYRQEPIKMRYNQQSLVAKDTVVVRI